ncbi:hypothetical protein [Streptomyces sp. SAS_260]|uniref:hypothetical protein n=1 Tax=Streptomyces sp. SAS_260 TaxID=3412751 RepID=UPI00403C73B6
MTRSATASDGVDQTLGAEVLKCGGEGLVGDEVVVEDLPAEPVERLVGLVAEDGLALLGDRLDGSFRDAGLDRLVHMGVPGVLRVPVAGGHQQREFAQVPGEAGVEPGEGAERFGALAHLRAVQPDPEGSADGAAPAGDAGGQFPLARVHFLFGENGEPHGACTCLFFPARYLHGPGIRAMRADRTGGSGKLTPLEMQGKAARQRAAIPACAA